MAFPGVDPSTAVEAGGVHHQRTLTRGAQTPDQGPGHHHAIGAAHRKRRETRDDTGDRKPALVPDLHDQGLNKLRVDGVGRGRAGDETQAAGCDPRPRAIVAARQDECCEDNGKGVREARADK